MTEEIFILAAALVHPAEEQRQLLRILSEAAARELKSLLKEGYTPESCGQEFYCAAALVAAADFGIMTAAGNGLLSFAAGNVSVHTGGCDEQAKLCKILRQHARLLLRGCVRDDGFIFEMV